MGVARLVWWAVLAGSVVLVRVSSGVSVPILLREAAPKLSYELGQRVFLHETFGGNGRTCATCHEPRNEFTTSPALVQQRFVDDPSHPLFRAIDSDDEDGETYTTMLTHAVFRVRVPLHPDVTVLDEPLRRTLKLWRGVPSIANVALTAPYGQDGRSPTLQSQARGAIRDHMEPQRRQFLKEVDALRTFLIELYNPLTLASLDADADPVPKPAGFSLPLESPAALRGKEAFDAHCRRCHGGEVGHVPDDPTRPQFADVFVSDFNVPGFPVLRLGFKQPDGSIVEAYTPDPGRAAITGDLADLNAFAIPPLRGVKHTSPYFHDNSAATLREVVEHYDREFQFRLSPQAVDDLITYLELL
jgi:cytochrome c peroxidase